MTHRPRILQVNKLYYPDIGGIETVVQSIAEQTLARFDPEVIACQPRGRGERAFINGVPVTRAGSLGTCLSMPVSLSFPLLFRKAIRRADLIHLHHPFVLGELSALLLNSNRKMVLTWYSAIVRQKLLSKLFRPFLERLLDRVEAIVVIYPDAQRQTKILAQRVNKCVVIPPGIEIRDYDMDATLGDEVAKIRSRYGEDLILFAGRLVYYKGVQHLIAAMPSVRGRLLVAGDGPLRQSLLRQAAELRVSDRVTLLGRLSDQDLKAVFHACDVFVLPSTHPSEAFGMVQLEAMACRKPVVNTRLETGVPYVSLDGVTGLTVEPANPEALAGALNKLLGDEGLRRALGEGGRERVLNEFTVQVMAERIMNLYEKVLGR